jgi:hypothetical protein
MWKLIFRQTTPNDVVGDRHAAADGNETWQKIMPGEGVILSLGTV